MKIEKELNLTELLNLALALEQRGEKFYKESAASQTKAEIKQIFSELAKQEKEHSSFFLKLLGKEKSYDPENPPSDDYYEYLYQYANISLFKIKEKKLEKGNIHDILNYAIDVELYSILYYFELQKYLDSIDHEILQSIILEEKSHYNKLVNLLKEYE
jgi:rubrerythrin